MSDTGGLVSALAGLPSVSGVVWRAADVELAGLFELGRPMPASRDLRVATENFVADAVYAFVVTSARDVGPCSAHPSEGEVVLLPGSTFMPAAPSHEVEGLRVQVVVEIPGEGEAVPAAVTDQQLALWVREARGSEPVPVFTPGKFGARPGRASN